MNIYHSQRCFISVGVNLQAADNNATMYADYNMSVNSRRLQAMRRWRPTLEKHETIFILHWLIFI